MVNHLLRHLPVDVGGAWVVAGGGGGAWVVPGELGTSVVTGKGGAWVVARGNKNKCV